MTEPTGTALCLVLNSPPPAAFFHAHAREPRLTAEVPHAVAGVPEPIDKKGRPRVSRLTSSIELFPEARVQAGARNDAAVTGAQEGCDEPPAGITLV